MSDPISKTQRWLDLIAYLVGRRLPVAVDELMERIPAYARKWEEGDERDRATARRTFERDKDELRALGIPLETVTYSVHHGAETIEGYRITRRDFYLPYLRLLARDQRRTPRPPRYPEPARVAEVELREDEVRIAADALWHVARLPDFPFAAEARSALRKLAFDIGEEPLAESSILFLDRPGTHEVRERMRVVADAVLDRKRVRFRYRGIRRGEETIRDVAPYGLFFRGDWYLVGHDALRDDLRVFRVARMHDVEPNRKQPKSPDFEVPHDFRLERYLGREAWELGDDADAPLAADVLFRFPASLWVERNGYGEEVERRVGGDTVRRFAVRQVNPFIRWILGLNGEAEILTPPELRAELREVAGAVAALHSSGGVGNG